jgi:hypothetical protein
MTDTLDSANAREEAIARRVAAFNATDNDLAAARIPMVDAPTIIGGWLALRNVA